MARRRSGRRNAVKELVSLIVGLMVLWLFYFGGGLDATADLLSRKLGDAITDAVTTTTTTSTSTMTTTTVPG